MSDIVEAFYKNGAGPTLLKTTDDVDALIDMVLKEQPTNSVIALYCTGRRLTARGYPDHELRIGVDADAEVGGIRYAGGDGAAKGLWYVPGRISRREEVFYYYQGHDEGWPQDSEVSVEDIRAAAKEFLTRGGERPASMQWHAWPDGVG